MPAIFELFDTTTANQIGTYSSIEEALVVVRRAVRTSGKSALQGIALGQEDDNGNTVVIARDEELCERAENDGNNHRVSSRLVG